MKGLLVLALWSGVVFGSQLEIKPDHGKIMFEVDYMKVSTVQGQFRKYTGTANINSAENQVSDVQVTIKTDSVDTDDPKRDFHLKDHEFFFASKYPEIKFNAKGPVAITKGKNFKMNGTLTMRGVTKPIVLNGIYKGKMADPDKLENYFFELDTVLDRKEFGMNWNKSMDQGGLLVGDKIRIHVNVGALIGNAKKG